MKQWLILILIGLTAACSSKKPVVEPPPPELRPDWVQQRPREPGYYIGIGVVRKTQHSFDYLEHAKQNAFNDLASQIQVNVQANSIQSQLERNRVFSDEFRSFTRLSSNVALEAYELVDTWQNEQEYWVFYRLSAAEFQRQKEARMQAAIEQSLDAYRRAKQAEKEGNPMGAYDFYFRGLEAVKAHIGEPLTYLEGGEQHFLGNELLESINRLSRDIAIRVNQRDLKGRIGKPIEQELLITVAYPRTNGQPVRNFPLKIWFSQGAGTIVGNTATDANGLCRIRIANIAARDALQEIRIEPDLEGLLRNDPARQLWLKAIDPQAISHEKVIVEVSKPSLLVLSNEPAEGQAGAQTLLESAARSRLAREGLQLTDRTEQVDYRLMIEAKLRQGPVNSGMYTALLDVKVTLVDVAGNERYSQTLSGVRGVQLDYARAAEAAYKRAAEDLELTVMPKVINVIYNL